MGLGAGPALLGTEQLEHVRTMLVRRLALVQATIDELAETDLRQASDSGLARTAAADAKADAEVDAAGTTTPAMASKRTRRPRTSARALPST
jgi:hypothetical protein